MACNMNLKDFKQHPLIHFEWLDEWWKAGIPDVQAKPDTVGHLGIDTPEWSQEYCGIASQGNGKHSPLLRKLRKVYQTYQQLWIA